MGIKNRGPSAMNAISAIHPTIHPIQIQQKSILTSLLFFTSETFCCYFIHINVVRSPAQLPNANK